MVRWTETCSNECQLLKCCTLDRITSFVFSLVQHNGKNQDQIVDVSSHNNLYTCRKLQLPLWCKNLQKKETSVFSLRNVWKRKAFEVPLRLLFHKNWASQSYVAGNKCQTNIFWDITLFRQVNFNRCCKGLSRLTNVC